MSLYSQAVTDNALCVWNLESATPTIDSFKGSIGTITRSTDGSPSFVSGSPTGSGYVRFANNSGFKFTQATGITQDTVNDKQIEAVFKTTNGASSSDYYKAPQYIYDKQLFGSLSIDVNEGFKLRLDFVDNNQTRTIYSNSAVNDNKWHHAVAGFINGEIAIYLDGIKQTETANRTHNTNSIAAIIHGVGETRSNTTNPNGFSDDLDIDFLATYCTYSAIGATILSPSQIANHFSIFGDAGYTAQATTASGLFRDPSISTIRNVNFSATPLTASALAGDTYASTINIVKLLNKYLTDLDLETYLKFDSAVPYNYGDGGQTQFYSVGNNTSYEVGGPDSAPYTDIGGTITTNILIPSAGEPLWQGAFDDQEWALGLWIKPTTNNNILQFRSEIEGNPEVTLSIGTTSNGYVQASFQTASGTGTLTGSTNIVNTNWHFVALRYSDAGNDLYLYVDGDLVGTAELSGSNLGVFDLTFNGGNKISSFFLDSFSLITPTVIEEIYDTATQFIQAGASMVSPKVSISTAYYDAVAAYSPIMEFKLDGNALPINTGSDDLTLSLIGDSADINVNQASKNVYSYNFEDKESYYSGSWSSSAFNDDAQTLVVLAKVDPALMDEGNTEAFGAFKILYSTNMGNGGGLQIGAYSNPVGTANEGYTPEGSGFYAYLPDVDYAREIVLASSGLDSQWHLLVATKDGLDFKFYVDGVLVDSVDDVEFEMASSGVSLLGGGEVFWWGETAGATDKTIDHVGVLNVALTNQQVFNLWQSVSQDPMRVTNATFALPVGTAGYGPTINPGVMYVSALLPDPTQQDTVAPTILPMTAFITTVTPNFAATSTATIAASPMTASATAENPVWSVGESNGALHMSASATFVDPDVLIPGFWNANPMIATAATFVDPAIVKTQGGLVLADPMRASAVIVLPPAYKTLFDDKWYEILYSQHSQRHNFTTPSGGSGEAILKLYDDVTSSVSLSTPLANRTVKNNLTFTITTDGSVVDETSPTMKVIGDFNPLTNTPIISTGFFDDYERKAVRFNNITTGYENSEYVNTSFSFEMSIKTTKANQIVAFGRTRSQNTFSQFATSLGLSDGKLFLATTSAQGPAPISHYKENVGNKMIGNKRIDDGQWHHIVVQFGWDDNRIQFWIDGDLDIQRIRGIRLDGLSFLGFNSQIPTYASDFQTSVWSYDTHRFILDQEIDNHRYAYIKYEPVRAEPMVASLTSGDHLGAGNRARALMLYWWPTDTFQGATLERQNETSDFDKTLSTADFIKSPPQEYYGWDIFPVDITGLYVSDLVKPEAYGGKENILIGSKPFIGTGQVTNKNPEYLYNSTGSFKDPVTDARRYLDVVNDIDLRNFDAIFFRNFPEDSFEKDEYTTTQSVDSYFGSKEAALYEAFLKSLRAAVDTGLSLYITNAQLALDLGIVDRVETVPDMDDLSGFDSDPYSPTLVPGGVNKRIEFAAQWYDSNKNNRLRVVNELEGFTTEPSFIYTDYAYYRNDDQISFGGPDYPYYRYVYRPDGLRVGDEFIIANDKRGGSRNFVATPFANVKAGTIITAFANNVRRRLDLIENPYKNYATAIVVKPGDALNGTQCGGKIVVNFTENLNGAVDWGNVDLITDYLINLAYNDGYIDEATKNRYLVAPYNLDRQLANGTITQDDYNKGIYWTDNGNNIISEAQVIDDPSASRPKDGIGSGTRSEIVTKTRKSGTAYSAKVSTQSQWFTFSYSYLLPRMGIKVPSILTRGFWWLSDRESYDGLVERPLAATANAVFVNPTVTAQKDRSVTATSMVSSATIVQAAGTSAAAINIAPLPMTALATINAYVTRYLATPMTASAILRTNNTIFTTAVDEVVVYVYHTDPILYLREDVIK